MTTKSYSLPPAPITSPSDSFSWAEWYRILRTVANLGQVAYITVNDTITPTLNSKLNKDANDVLNGTVSFGTSGAFKVGTATWNGTSGTGTGVLFTQNGIVGMNGGSPKFVLKVDGTATFGGDLTAATGTFAGSLSAATGTFAGSLSAATGTFAGSLSAASGTFTGNLVAAGGTFAGTLSANSITGGTMSAGTVNTTGSVTATGTTSSVIGNASVVGAPSTAYTVGVGGLSSYVGVWGQTTTGIGTYGYASGAGVGVYGQCYTTGGIGVYASGAFGATALRVDGPMTMTNTSIVANLNADMVDGVHLAGLLQTNNSVTSGSATATFSGTNKPGSNSSASWLPVTIAGTTYYIPVWT